MRLLSLLLFPLTLAACSAGPEEPVTPPAEEAEPAQPAPAPVAAASNSPTQGGDGSPIHLTALIPADLEANPLEGELGCHFVEEGKPLLVAMGNVADENGHAQGLAKIGDYTERLFAREAGGFDGLPDGAEFSGKGMTFTVTRTSDTPVGAGESPPYPAELLAQRADGAERMIVGRWTCGP